jgi:hypothetical protein
MKVLECILYREEVLTIKSENYDKIVSTINQLAQGEKEVQINIHFPCTLYAQEFFEDRRFRDIGISTLADEVRYVLKNNWRDVSWKYEPRNSYGSVILRK